MFVLEGNLTFINIDQDYLKRLHDVCTEVYYKPRGYENKPYIGILINKENRKYVIPLSSAKEKHKTWKNVNKECYLIYEYVKKSCMGKNEIWVETEPDNVKHILSVIDIKKMIPIVDGLYSRVNINDEENDSDTFSWNEVVKWNQDPDNIYLFVGDDNCLVVSKKGFTQGSADDLRQLADAVIGMRNVTGNSQQ